MTSRTHDLAAFTGLTIFIATQPAPPMTLATAVAALGSNLLGGLVPDIDEPTDQLWNRLPAGSIVGRIIHPLLGSHRLISHSIVGLVIFGFLFRQLLTAIGGVLLVNMNIVWWTFMIGYFSHLLADTVTKEGVPWLFPIPFRFGLPPLKFLRLTTGGIVEKSFIFPGLMLLNGYLIYQSYPNFFAFIKSLAH